jgi:hypothetical protein
MPLRNVELTTADSRQVVGLGRSLPSYQPFTIRSYCFATTLSVSNIRLYVEFHVIEAKGSTPPEQKAAIRH